MYNVNTLVWIGYYATTGVADEAQVIAHANKVKWVSVFGENFHLHGCDITRTISDELVNAARANGVSLLMRTGAVQVGAENILADQSRQDDVIDAIVNHPNRDLFDGIAFDWEGISDAYEEQWITFLTRLKSALGGKLLFITVPAKSDETRYPAYDYPRLGSICDKLIPQMYVGNLGETDEYYREVLNYAMSVMPKEKFVPNFSLTDPLEIIDRRIGIAVNEFGLNNISAFRMDLATEAFWNLIERPTPISPTELLIRAAISAATGVGLILIFL